MWKLFLLKRGTDDQSSIYSLSCILILQVFHHVIRASIVVSLQLHFQPSDKQFSVQLQSYYYFRVPTGIIRARSMS